MATLGTPNRFIAHLLAAGSAVNKFHFPPEAQPKNDFLPGHTLHRPKDIDADFLHLDFLFGATKNFGLEWRTCAPKLRQAKLVVVHDPAQEAAAVNSL